MSRRDFGDMGEGVAVKYLEDRGYEVLGRNFVTKLGEVDIIVRQGETIVFVEVKTRKSAYFADPWMNVNRKKMKKVWQVGQVFLSQKGLMDRPARVDVVSVVLGSGKLSDSEGEPEIEHFESVLEE